ADGQLPLGLHEGECAKAGCWRTFRQAHGGAIPGLTMPGFFIVYETEYAREFIEAQVASSTFPLAVFVFGVPVGQEDIAISCREACFANRTSGLRVRWRLRNFQVGDWIQAVHQVPPC